MPSEKVRTPSAACAMVCAKGGVRVSVCPPAGKEPRRWSELPGSMRPSAVDAAAVTPPPSQVDGARRKARSPPVLRHQLPTFPPAGIFLPSTLSQRPDRRDEAATTERRAGSHGMGRAPPRAALTRHRRGAPRAPRSHVSALAVAPIAATRAARPTQAEVVRVSRCSMRHYLIFNFHCGFVFGPVSSIVFRACRAEYRIKSGTIPHCF